MNTVQTSTQKYNELKTLVKRSYADENMRNEIWKYITGYILTDDKKQIQEDRLEQFTTFLCHTGRLAHIDIVVDATDINKYYAERDNAFINAVEKVWPSPWASFCYGKTVGTDHELTRFFYMKKEG
ncbi:hypothetical protein [uncultured Fibrobacter sp.]|uniref:hypothetical protein n=1 Tax=uncultured Fibrobacter sp. TaxID=261512 RepID=UPI0025FA51EA|nr:hypothetical protein [uncultured Fibrobacter sp.]MBR6122685.1 hypothetical protein [Candidatus Saccharibacteria bacterium]